MEKPPFTRLCPLLPYYISSPAMAVTASAPAPVPTAASPAAAPADTDHRRRRVIRRGGIRGIIGGISRVVSRGADILWSRQPHACDECRVNRARGREMVIALVVPYSPACLGSGGPVNRPLIIPLFCQHRLHGCFDRLRVGINAHSASRQNHTESKTGC